MNDQPLVSVLMTSYNREKYIANAMMSVLNSSLREIELIIVDDGSKDNTLSVARDIASRDSRVRVYQNPQNLGDYPNRNKAASYANGKYLKYVDSDDFIYPWALQLMVEMMEQFPGAGWGLCSLVPDIERPFPFELTPQKAYEYHYNGPGLFGKAPLSSIIKRTAFEEAGGFNNIRMAGDYEMWHRMGQRFNVVLMPQGMVWYRFHDAQEINVKIDFINTYEKIKVDYLLSEKCPLDKQTVKAIIAKEKRMVQKALLANLYRRQFRLWKINRANLKLLNQSS